MVLPKTKDNGCFVHFTDRAFCMPRKRAILGEKFMLHRQCLANSSNNCLKMCRHESALLNYCKSYAMPCAHFPHQFTAKGSPYFFPCRAHAIRLNFNLCQLCQCFRFVSDVFFCFGLITTSIVRNVCASCKQHDQFTCRQKILTENHIRFVAIHKNVCKMKLNERHLLDCWIEVQN